MIINLDVPYTGIITVTYPGGTCTVSHASGASYSHTGGGTVSFTVHQKGEWTVKAVDESKTTEKKVTLSSRGQVATVELIYRKYLFNQGNSTGYTWSSQGEIGGGTVGTTLAASSGLGWGECYAQVEIDRSKFSKIGVTVSSVSGPYALLAFTSDYEADDYNKEYSITSTGQKTFTLDIATGSWYVCVAALNSAYYNDPSAQASSITVSQIWLE